MTEHDGSSRLRHRIAVVTVSDRATHGEREDRSGPAVRQELERALDCRIVAMEVIPDEHDIIEETLVRLCDDLSCDLIVTTGGTGLSPRDVTPEATQRVIDREIPGMAEAMRAAGLAHTPHAMLSRAVCGQRDRTIIVNLSGSPHAVREQIEVLLPVLPHALETAAGRTQDCGEGT